MTTPPKFGELLESGFSERPPAATPLPLSSMVSIGGRISETTVKSHLRSVFAKLNVLSRTEALAVAGRLGLLQR